MDIARKRCDEYKSGVLNLSYLGLTSLPTLPHNVEHLFCNHNRLESLPILPPTVSHLYCQANKLTKLPNLPPNLLELHCHNNELHYLPILPETLAVLECHNNELTALPSIPSTLMALHCNHNQLTSLPSLPVSLSRLYVESHPNLFPIDIHQEWSIHTFVMKLQEYEERASRARCVQRCSLLSDELMDVCFRIWSDKILCCSK